MPIIKMLIIEMLIIGNLFETDLTYLNLTKPNLIDVPDLPTLVNRFETMLQCTYRWHRRHMDINLSPYVFTFQIRIYV